MKHAASQHKHVPPCAKKIRNDGVSSIDCCIDGVRLPMMLECEATRKNYAITNGNRDSGLFGAIGPCIRCS